MILIVINALDIINVINAHKDMFEILHQQNVNQFAQQVNIGIHEMQLAKIV